MSVFLRQINCCVFAVDLAFDRANVEAVSLVSAFVLGAAYVLVVVLFSLSARCFCRDRHLKAGLLIILC